jgi:hypothetical protein
MASILLCVYQHETEDIDCSSGQQWLHLHSGHHHGDDTFGNTKRSPPDGTLGWGVLKTEQRDAALQEFSNFVAFADSWFGVVPYRKIVLYNANTRRVDVCFQSIGTGSGGFKAALEFSLARDWPITDESDWFW